MEQNPPTNEQQLASMEVINEGLMDLCANEGSIWPATASWLYEGFITHLKQIQPKNPTTEREPCSLSVDKTNYPTRDFNAAVKMISDPGRRAEGTQQAREAILSGQVSAQTILGPLMTLKAANPASLNDLLSAVISLEEQHPGAIPLQMMTFFFPLFMGKAVPPELLTRYLFVAVSATRLTPEQLIDPAVRTRVIQILSSVRPQAEIHAPALYPEIVSRLNSVSDSSWARIRQTALERIQQADNPLQQTIVEANATTDPAFKRQLLFKGAELARDGGDFRTAADLAEKIDKEIESINGAARTTMASQFLIELVQRAINRGSTRDALYAITKISQAISKAAGYRILGQHYGEARNEVESKQAFVQSVKELKRVDTSNEKVSAWLLLGETVLKYQPLDSYEVFRESVKTINDLPSPEKDKEAQYYQRLLPIADQLIQTFGSLAMQDRQTAGEVASAIKAPELRLAAYSGIYSKGELLKKEVVGPAN